jgi:flagellar L-ring protein precursor FlgH
MKLGIAILLSLLLAPAAPAKKKKEKPAETTPLDVYVREAQARQQAAAVSTPGSAWNPTSRLTDLGSDLRARLVDDMVTILVAERASAVSTGATKTARQSQVKSAVTAAGGVTRASGPLANLAAVNTATQLDGNGTTSRDTTVATTLAARVVAVLPNGYLVVQANKEIEVNSERQLITVRGVVRPVDLSPGNVVQSNNLAQLEVHINGKGVVGDAIRRPFFLYRLLLGLLPF